jgi:excisionase family DNA binding protein
LFTLEVKYKLTLALLHVLIQQESNGGDEKYMKAAGQTVSIREAAIRLGFSMKYIYDLCYLGKLPAKKIARQWRIPVEAVQARLKQRRA